MSSKGIVRGVDNAGRVVIPKEYRKQLNVENDVDSFEISIEGDTIILKKHRPACFFCDKLDIMVDYMGYNVCANCVEKLKALLDETK